MTEMSEANEINPLDVYNMYGNRQQEFSYLPDWAQAEVVEYCHVIAIVMDEFRGMEIVKVCADGYKITRAMVEQEIRETRARRPESFHGQRLPWIIGVNASVDMFA